jgi:hypothetical protein
MLTALSLAGGCSTMNGTYLPQQVGPVRDYEPTDGLKVTIDTDQEYVRHGDPVVFEVTVKNASARTCRVPQDPEIVMIWTYSDGTRDNFLTEAPQPRDYAMSDTVRLAPGESLKRRVPVETQAFRQGGVTEFHAMLQAPACAHGGMRDLWTGEALSNDFGVMVTGFGERSRPDWNRPAETAGL